MTLLELDTPAVAVDLDVMESNLRKMAIYARQHNLRLRPHTKTHKSPLLARKQLELGAAGLTVAKPTEAEVMLCTEPATLLVAFPTFGWEKLLRLKEVARHTSLSVSLDSYEAAKQLSGAEVPAGVLVEFDAGLGRAGVGVDELPDLVEAIAKLPNLRYEGIAFYPGHMKEKDEAKLVELNRLLERAIDTLTARGLKPALVSGGSTPTWHFSHRVQGMNEIRPGTYIFNDRNTIGSGACTVEECAAQVIVTVVSTARPGQILIDGGSKTFSSDRLNGDSGVSFGMVIGEPEAHFHKMNEEHGFIDVSKCSRKFEVGERLGILMNHVCVVMNLHEKVFGHRRGNVETEWPVAARGKLQ